MITNFNKKNRKDDIKILSLIILGFLILVWLCTPPGNKFAQIAFYGSKTQFLIAKLTVPKTDLDEWVFHRNNAIYLARMERKEASLKEMDEAIRTFPSYLSDSDLNSLYNDRAQLRLFWGEYSGALDDYLRIKEPGLTDRFRIALLYKKKQNYKYALSYCNSIINIDTTAYIGYACVADVYAGVGRYNTSVRVFDMLIDKSQNRARYYADRAFYKKKAGDFDGYKEDMTKAKNLSPMVESESDIIEETLNPKVLSLTIM